MKQTCSVTGKSFEISDAEQNRCKELGMPLMDICHEERKRQLMATRNEWKLYHRKCDATGENILSAYPSDSPYKVYENSVWWGDSWEALDYGREFDFNRPFFEQFYELQLEVPREGTSVFDSQNCAYNGHLRCSKNCYLNSLVIYAEDLYYSYWMVSAENVIDCCYHIAGKCSLCYEALDFGNCYDAIAIQECYNCNDCYFSYQLRGCDHCLFCTNLSNKSYHLHNKPCTKEEFEEAKKQAINGSYESWLVACKTYEKIRLETIHRGTYTLNCENTFGDHMFDSKNCYLCFDGDENEDCSHSISLNNSKDIHSCYSSGWPRCELLYNCAVSRGCIDMAFCRYMWFSNDMRYCDSCQTCKHCFGCTGLRHKDYCILNKQYSKEEYEELLPKIIDHMKSTGEWGTFWPYDTLAFTYNESAAQDYFPLERQEALDRGFMWRDEEEEIPDVEKIIPADKLPDHIDDIPNDVLNWAIRCKETNVPFRIIKQELDFYRRMQLPLPRIHPKERHRLRMLKRNPYKLWERTCPKCNKKILSSYDLNRPETVYCEKCFLQEVY